MLSKRISVQSLIDRIPALPSVFLVVLAVFACTFLCLPESAASTEGNSQAQGNEPFEGDYLVTFWRTADGLPHDTVNALLQTRDGYLWVGTSSGLARFDGLKFTVIGEEGFQALDDTPITALLEDDQGALWIGTQHKGLFRLFQGKLDRFSLASGLAGNSITSLALAPGGVIWIGTTEGLNCWMDGKLAQFVAPGVPKGENIVALNAGGSGNLWITTRSGVFCLRDGEATAFKSDQLPQGRNAEFIGAYEDRSGNLWAFGATFLLNVTQGQSLNNFASFSLASSRVWTICEQSNANFWIGTSGQGLFRFQNGRFEVVGAREGLEQCDIRALHADRWGNLWIGTGGNGLVRLRTRRVKVVGANAGVYSRNLSAIAPDGEGGLWIATADSGLWRWNGQQAEPWSGGGALGGVTQVQSVCLDTQKNLWVGTIGSGIITVSDGRQLRMSTEDGLAENSIFALVSDDSAGCVWAGTQSGFLHRIQGRQIKTFAPPMGHSGAILCLLETEGNSVIAGFERGGIAKCDGTNIVSLSTPPELSTKPVRCLFEDRHQRLWAGTWGGGAFCRQGDFWVGISKMAGLGSDNVGMITQSDTGVFWFGTSENLLKTRAMEVENFLTGIRNMISFVPALAVVDGLKCARGWPNTAFSPQKSLWLACSSELLPLAETEKPGSEPAPPVILERVLVNGKPQALSPDGMLKLGPGARSLDFEFTAISFTAPQKVQFRHKLENFDADWVESDMARRAHYGPLPAGQYRFRVIAANVEKVWNETGASMGVIVTPPIWRAWWFLTLSGAATATGIWAAARYISTRRLEARLRAAEQQHAMERERARIARDMHDEIGSKLTRISFLSEVARHSGANAATPTQPVEAIASTSRELLQSLDEIVWAVNPRNDNLEQLAGYLEQHAREYFQGTPCECRIAVPAQLPEAPLSAELRHNVFLAFEEALNNSLKHAGARNVSLTMAVENRWFEIRVQDDGRGFDPAKTTKPQEDGLRNMRERLEGLGGVCEITSRPGAGTTVTLRFPLAVARRTGTLNTETSYLKK